MIGAPSEKRTIRPAPATFFRLRRPRSAKIGTSARTFVQPLASLGFSCRAPGVGRGLGSRVMCLSLTGSGQPYPGRRGVGRFVRNRASERGSGLGKPVVLRVEVEAAPIPAARRNSVLERGPTAKRVLSELLAHHLSRGSLREPEPLPEHEARLEGVALGRSLVALPAKMPSLVGENGERAGGPTRGDLVVERQSIEIVTTLRGQVRAIASDGGDAVRVLDEPDVVARLVAADRDRLPCDAGCLVRETRSCFEARLPVERVPAGAAVDEPQDEHECAYYAQASEKAAYGRPERAALRRGRGDRWLVVRSLTRRRDELLDLFVALTRVRDPELFVAIADEQEIVRLLDVAVALPVDG